MNKITIIIPMYNEEKNLEQCIDNLKKQTNQSFDVCFVDDGSTDNTIKVLKNQLEKNIEFRYKIFSQKNSGAATARKKGVELSNTPYISMIDCDDSVSSNYIEQFIQIIEKSDDVDIIIPNMKIEDNLKNWKDFNFYTKDVYLNPLHAVSNTFGGWKVHGIFCIRKLLFLESYNLYNKYNLNNQNFINNDEVITRFNLLNARNIVRSEAIYYYHYNEISTTKRVNEKRYLMLRNTLIMKEAFADIPGLKKSVYSEIISSIWGTYKYYENNKLSLNNKDNWIKELKYSINQIPYRRILLHLPLKAKVQFLILKKKFWGKKYG